MPGQLTYKLSKGKLKMLNTKGITHCRVCGNPLQAGEWIKSNHSNGLKVTHRKCYEALFFVNHRTRKGFSREKVIAREHKPEPEIKTPIEPEEPIIETRHFLTVTPTQTTPETIEAK